MAIGKLEEKFTADWARKNDVDLSNKGNLKEKVAVTRFLQGQPGLTCAEVA